MIIERKHYLNKLISKKENGLVKVITGIRRSGKSFLLFKLYHSYLNSIGIQDKYIIELELDSFTNIKYRNPLELGSYIKNLIEEKDKTYYVFLDEIQAVEEIQNPYIQNKKSTVGFVDVLLGLMNIKNLDIYVTGSNSKMLSSDIITEFRGRGDEIRVYPLSFKEFYDHFEGDKNNAWKQYYTYGGMPKVALLNSHEEKSEYLKTLFQKTYFTDIIEHNKIKNEDIIKDLLNFIASNIGSLTNPLKLSNTFKTVKKISVSPATISKYLDYFIDAFIIKKIHRYDVKGRKYIDTPLKYYFTDVGLRNAMLGFRQNEENHIMENIIYNELLLRGFDIDIGVVEYSHEDEKGKYVRTYFEIDFIANKGSSKYYIQSALNIETKEKREQETQSLNRINDSFKKIVIVKDDIIPWHDDKGILYLGIQEFLLNPSSINL